MAFTVSQTKSICVSVSVSPRRVIEALPGDAFGDGVFFACKHPPPCVPPARGGKGRCCVPPAWSGKGRCLENGLFVHAEEEGPGLNPELYIFDHLIHQSGYIRQGRLNHGSVIQVLVIFESQFRLMASIIISESRLSR